MKRAIYLFIFFIIIIFIWQTPNYAKDTDITQNFKDENLRETILQLAKEATGEENKTKIYEEDIDKIIDQPGGTSLKLAGKGIKDLSGIEIFEEKGINWIFLDWNEITDLTPISNFKTLEKISFSGNQIVDLTPLAKLENLENVIGINNKIETIEPIKDLKNVKYINLDGNLLEEIRGIENWIYLKEISFQNNKIKEIPNLQKLQELEYINLSNNEIGSLNNIPQIETLKKFEIDSNKLTNLDGIQNCINLEIFSCSNNQIENLQGIENLVNLENLNVNKNQLYSINDLNQNTELRYLYADNNYLSNLGFLEVLSNLEKYSIYNQIIAVEIKEELTGKIIKIPLPELYEDLYNPDSILYNGNLKTEVLNASEFHVNEDKKSINLRLEDLKKEDIIVQVSDDKNTILRYVIQIDRISPKVTGIEEGKTYSTSVIPQSADNDIKEVILFKDNNELEYELGNELKEEGQYKLIVKDRAGNKTEINFEIRYNFESGEEYQIKGKYIIGILPNTDLKTFTINLNGNVPYNVYRNGEFLSNDSIISTGDELITDYNKTFYLIVKGDVSKDGKITIKDLVKVRKRILELEEFDDLQERAADVSNDEKITIKDLVQIRKIILNVKI